MEVNTHECILLLNSLLHSPPCRGNNLDLRHPYKRSCWFHSIHWWNWGHMAYPSQEFLEQMVSWLALHGNEMRSLKKDAGEWLVRVQYLLTKHTVLLSLAMKASVQVHCEVSLEQTECSIAEEHWSSWRQLLPMVPAKKRQKSGSGTHALAWQEAHAFCMHPILLSTQRAVGSHTGRSYCRCWRE